MIAQFNRFEIEMTKEQAYSVTHPGKCDADVEILLENPKIKRQLKKISDEDLAAELYDYAGWDVSDRKTNEQRIIWIAGGNIIDEL